MLDVHRFLGLRFIQPNSAWAWIGVLALSPLVGCASLTPSPKDLSKAEVTAKTYSRSQVDLKVGLAVAAEKRGEYDLAIQTYNELIDLNLADAEVYHRLALIHDRHGKCQKAAECYEAACQLDSENAELICDYGYSLYLSERWDESEQTLRRAIEVDSTNVRARANLGLLLARTGRVDQALQQFMLAGLSESEAQHNVAMAAAQGGDTTTAMRAIEQSRLTNQDATRHPESDEMRELILRLAQRAESGTVSHSIAHVSSETSMPPK